MKYTEICNDKWLFIWVGLLLFAVIAQCMLFMSKAWKHGMEIGLKQSQLKKGLKTGITISIMPTLPVLLVLFSLTPLLGIPRPWLRLSVIGSAYYETYAATTALSCLGETFQINGYSANGWIAALWVMTIGGSVCILWSAFAIKPISMLYEKAEKINIKLIGLPVAASLIYGIWPDFGELWPGFVAVVLFMAPYLPSETIGYMSVMGPGALYLSYITGNVTNLRMPATIGTINALGIKPNTDECHTLAIIACGASVITSIVIVALGVVVSGPLTPIIQAPVLQPAFDYVVPALFGGLVAQTVIKGKKEIFHYLIPLAVCLFFCYCTKVASAYYMLIVIAVSAVVAVMDYLKTEKKEERGE